MLWNTQRRLVKIVNEIVLVKLNGLLSVVWTVHLASSACHYSSL